MLSNFFSWLRKTMEESEGVPSMVRFQLFATLMAGLFPILVWACVCFYEKKLVEMPQTIIAFSTLLVGVATTAKQIQYPKEPENNKGA